MSQNIASKIKLETKWEHPILEKYFSAHDGAVNSISFNDNASGGTDGIFNISNFKHTTRMYIFNDRSGTVQHVRFSPDGKLVASVAGSVVRIRKPQMRTRCWSFRPHVTTVHCVDFSHDTALLATCSSDKSVKIWDIGNCRSRFLRTLGTHRNWVRWINFSPDDTMIISASDDGTLKIWDPRCHSCVCTISCYHFDPVLCAKFHSNGYHVVNCGKSDIQAWDMRSKRQLLTFAEHSSPLTSIDVSGDYVCSSSLDGTVKVYNLLEGRITHTLHGHECPVFAAEFTKQLDYIASADKKGQIFLWRTNF